MTDLDLDELRRLTREATPGPWVDGAGDIFAEADLEDGMCRDGCCEVASCYGRNRHADEALIVAARNALPELLDECERLRAGLRDIAYDDGGECAYRFHDGPRHLMDEECPGSVCWAKRTLTPPVVERKDAS